MHLRVAYEDVIFGTLALALVLLAGFCLGVERGKHVGTLPFLSDPGVGTASAQAPRERLDPPAAAALREARAGASMPVIRVSTPVVSGSAVSRAESKDLVEGTYVIQLASYNGERSAREEANRLEKQGVRAQVVPQGRYFELRAAGYRTRAEAKSALGKLSKTYRDAFIKRLSS